MTRTEELMKLAEAATPGPWFHCQPFQTVGKINTIHGPVPKTRVDFVSCEKEPVHKTVIIPMEGRGSHVASINMAHIAAANPETIKQLVELVRLQHSVIKVACTSPENMIRYHEAIAAFNKFEGGE